MENVRIDFRDQISGNKLKSFFLMFFIFAILVLFGYVISFAFEPGFFFIIMIISIIISLSYIWISFYNSGKIAIASVGAKVAKRELEGVLAHELGHVANYDIRYMTLITVMVGMVAIISELFLRSLWFSGDHDNKNAIFIVIGIALAILAPIVVQLVQLGISRKREFTADATAVKFTRYPAGLIGALKKIKSDYAPEEKKVSKAVAPLFFSNPLKGWGSTHPPIEKRIATLEKM